MTSGLLRRVLRQLMRRARPAQATLDEAMRLYHQGKDAEAQRCFRAIHAAQPQLAAQLFARAETAKDAGQHDAAIASFLAAALLDSENAHYASRLADTLYLAGEQEEALAWLRRAGRGSRDDAWRVKDLVMRLPPVYRSRAHLREARADYLAGLEALEAASLRIENPFGEVRFTNFLLAYQGENERDSQARLAQVLRTAAPMLDFRAPSLDHTRRAGRLRVGFVSRYLGHHSVGRCYNELIGALAAHPELEVTVALLSVGRAEEARQQIGPAARYVVLPAHLAGVRQVLCELALDVLVFTDIGMEPSSYFLAFGRYARVQGVLAGHPLTTGIPTVDFFVSSHANEAPGAQAHYSERLVLLKGLPVAIPAPPPLAPVSRASLGLPEDAHLYVCPMKLQKLHPDFDAAIAGILEADARALILLFEDDARERWGEAVNRRLGAALGAQMARLRFLRWRPFGELLQLLAASDVVLDTFHFGAGTTAFYALASGSPVVTLPAAYLRGRHTLGYYAKMEVHDCVARDVEDYVKIAVRIATQRDYQRDLRRRIAERRETLTARDPMVEEFAGCLLSENA